MRDMVEIGMGRTARRTYELDDINIVPSRRTRSSQDVSTAWQLDAYRFEIPVVAHPTDALVSPEFAIELGRLGGLGVLNGEGLIGRHADVEAKIAQVIEAAAKEPEPTAAIRLLQQLACRAAGPRAAGRGGGPHPRRRGHHRGAGQPAERPVADAGAGGRRASTCWSSRARIISAERVASDGEPLNLKTFISELDVPVVAGGVLDHRTALHLMRTGAAGVIVGYGSTRGVTTSDEVLGISVPMATAIADAAAARREYLDETGGRYVHVLADGDIHTLRRPGQGHRLRGRRGGARHAAGRGGRGARRRLVLAARPPRTRRCRAVRCCRSRWGSGRPLRAGAQRAVRRPVRLAEPRRRPAPVDGQGGLLRPQGIPEGRPDRRQLSRFAKLAGITSRASSVRSGILAGWNQTSTF